MVPSLRDHGTTLVVVASMVVDSLSQLVLYLFDPR
jgi:hypothetical protein